jgi:hypothetical protein
VPPGGAAGSFLQKKSTVDFDFQWATSTSGLPTGGTAGQVLAKNSNATGDIAWVTPSASGGSGNPTIFYSPTQPTALAVGDIWINTSGAY